jgi:hypothetical protein
MRILLIVLASAALAGRAGGAEEPGIALSAQAGEGEWAPLIQRMAAKGPVVAAFTERRYFPFRREPTTLRGVMRFVPGKGLSLQYTDPEPSILIADAEGLLLRDKDGRNQSLPADSRESGAIASLLPIMRFDLAALYPRFLVRARHEDPGWRFTFTPRNADVARSLGEIALAGVGTQVTHIEFRHSASTRVEIDDSETSSGTALAAGELKRYFR